MIAIFGRGSPGGAVAHTDVMAAEIPFRWQNPNGKFFGDSPRQHDAFPTAWCVGGRHITNPEAYLPARTARVVSISAAVATRAASAAPMVPPKVTVREGPVMRRKLHDRLVDAGHELVRLGPARWRCTHCRWSQTRRRLRSGP